MKTFWVLLALAAVQAVVAAALMKVLRSALHTRSSNAASPKTAVILSLRGADPFLLACLEGVLNQDYPTHDVYIVVDSTEDPAWPIVTQVVAQSGRADVQIQSLTRRLDTCSLKCSSLLQVVSGLDATYEAIALLDADTIPHPTWLQELVAPLGDNQVAAATATRWYMPTCISWGSLVRWIWNAGAAVQMNWWCIPWGGSLAIKTSILRQSDLLDRWAHAFSDDTIIFSVVRRLGYRIEFVPTLVMVNRENISLGTLFRWIRRQLLTVRLYHPFWPFGAAYGLGSAFAQLTGLFELVAALAEGHGRDAGWLASGLGVYWTETVVLLVCVEVGVRRVVALRGDPTTWLGMGGVPYVVPAMLLTQAFSGAALLSTMFLKRVEWRGIEYEVRGAEKIRMMEYRPYSASNRLDKGKGGSLSSC